MARKKSTPKKLCQAARAILTHTKRRRRRPRRLPWPPPQMCVGLLHHSGTVHQYGERLLHAYTLGYRHFDGADNYMDTDEHYACLRRVFAKWPRHRVWITWKGDEVAKIPKTLERLGLDYFDAYLIHHSCGEPADHVALETLRRQKKLRFFGMSNCEDLGSIATVRQRYPYCRLLQIQARPPGGSVANRAALAADFIPQCNAKGMAVMLFALHSGIVNRDAMMPEGLRLPEVVPWYLQQFVRGKSNVIIVGMGSGLSTMFGAPDQDSLQTNWETWQQVKAGTLAWSRAKMSAVQALLESVELTYQ